MICEIEPIIKYWLQITSQMHVEQLEIAGVRARLQISLDDVIFYRLAMEGRPDDLVVRGHYSSRQHAASEPQNAEGAGCGTTTEELDFKRLIQEVLCYFPRALAYLKMGDFRACAFDVHHCLSIVKLASTSTSASCLRFRQMAPILHMLYYLSLAALSLECGHKRRAINYLNRGIYRIRMDHVRLGENVQFSGYKEILRIKLFKRMVIDSFARRPGNKKRTAMPPMEVARGTHPQDHICHLLSAPWRLF